MVDDDKNEEEDLAKEVKTCGLVIIATFVSTSVASSQVLGRWIDRWSCRTVTFFPLTGVVAWAACGLLVTTAPSLPLYLWLVGAAIGGSSGGFVTLRAAATIYAVQAAPHWDSTVRLAFLQAATSLGVLLAYLSWYFLAADPQNGMTSVFIGMTVLGILNIFFVLVFLSDKSPTPPVTTTTTSPGAAPGTQIIAHDSSSILDRCVSREEWEEDEDKEEERGRDEDGGEDDRDNVSKEKVRKMGKYEKEVLTAAGMENHDECDGIGRNFGKAIMSSLKKTQNDNDVGPRSCSSLPINIFVTPPEEDARPVQMKTTVESTPRSKRKRKLGVIHNFVNFNAWTVEDERPHDSGTSGPWTKCVIPSTQNKIPIIISPEDGNSVYGTPPEQSTLPVSRCGTPPSRAPSCYHSCTSLETAAAGGQRSGLSTGQQQPEARAGASSYDHHPYYERPRHQITGLSSSAPSTFPSLMEERSEAAPDVLLEETQTVNKTEVIHSQGDMLTAPNVLLDPASSLGSVLGCEGSNTSTNNSIIGSSSGESRDVMRGDARDMLYDCASLGDMQGPLPFSASTTRTLLGSSYDSTSLRRPGSMLTLQSEGVTEVGEREGRGALAPLAVAGESGGKGGCCAGGGGAGRCLACVAGRLFCRPVSLTFRRRAAGLRGIVVADVVAAFLVSVVKAGVWGVTPLYLETKMEWSLADRISYLACRSCLGVVALVMVLPLLRRLWSLQDTTLGVLGGVSSLLSSICLSALSSSPSVIPLAILLGPLTPYLNVASSAILVRLAAVTELGGVLVCLGSVEQAGHAIGWLTFYYLFPLLLLHRMPGVTFLATGLLLLVPSTIFGVLYFSLGLRSSTGRSPRGRSASRIRQISASFRYYEESPEGART